MRFDRFSFIKDKHWIHIIPTIEIYNNDLSICFENISIGVHLLCFHFRWRWIKAGGKND